MFLLWDYCSPGMPIDRFQRIVMMRSTNEAKIPRTNVNMRIGLNFQLLKIGSYSTEDSRPITDPTMPVVVIKNVKSNFGPDIV